MDLVVKYIIHSYEIDETRYRVTDIESGLMADLTSEGVKNYSLDISKAKRIEIRNFYKFSGTLKTGLNDFETYCRMNKMLDVLADYNRAANEKKASEISQGSITQVNWVCSKGHNWSTPIKSRTGQTKSGCPECAQLEGKYHTFIKGKNDFVTWCKQNNREDLLLEYSPKNKLDPSSIAPSNQTSVLWKCNKCGHEFKNAISNRARLNQGCPMCTRNGSSIPEMSLYFYVSNIFKDVKYRAKINGYEADILIEDIKTVIDYRGSYWHSDREQMDSLKVQLFKSLGYSTIVITQNYTYVNTINPDYITFDGKDINKVIEMLCNVMKLEYSDKSAKESVDLAISSKQHKKVINSIAETHPEICDRWDYEKNLGLTPENFTAGTKYKAWFKCKKCGYSYYSHIRKQVKGQSCPVCAKGGDAVSGINDLVTTRPDYIKVWNFELNNSIGVNPSKIKEGSVKKAYFTCPKCGFIQDKVIREVFKNPWYRCKNCKTKTPLE